MGIETILLVFIVIAVIAIVAARGKAKRNNARKTPGPHSQRPADPRSS